MLKKIFVIRVGRNLKRPRRAIGTTFGPNSSGMSSEEALLVNA